MPSRPPERPTAPAAGRWSLLGGLRRRLPIGLLQRLDTAMANEIARQRSGRAALRTRVWGVSETLRSWAGEVQLLASSRDAEEHVLNPVGRRALLCTMGAHPESEAWSLIATRAPELTPEEAEALLRAGPAHAWPALARRLVSEDLVRRLLRGTPSDKGGPWDRPGSSPEAVAARERFVVQHGAAAVPVPTWGPGLARELAREILAAIAEYGAPAAHEGLLARVREQLHAWVDTRLLLEPSPRRVADRMVWGAAAAMQPLLEYVADRTPSRRARASSASSAPSASPATPSDADGLSEESRRVFGWFLRRNRRNATRWDHQLIRVNGLEAFRTLVRHDLLPADFWEDPSVVLLARLGLNQPIGMQGHLGQPLLRELLETPNTPGEVLGAMVSILAEDYDLEAFLAHPKLDDQAWRAVFDPAFAVYASPSGLAMPYPGRWQRVGMANTPAHCQAILAAAPSQATLVEGFTRLVRVHRGAAYAAIAQRPQTDLMAIHATRPFVPEEVLDLLMAEDPAARAAAAAAVSLLPAAPACPALVAPEPSATPLEVPVAPTVSLTVSLAAPAVAPESAHRTAPAPARRGRGSR